MSYNSNIGTLPEGRLRISGSAIEVTGRFAISGSRVEITGSMYAGDISGAVGQFSSLTASSLDVANLSADTITAREYYTELITASVIYESGSTKFGDDANDVHQFSGSIQQSGNIDNYFLGNLGLGTTSPSYELEVVGDVSGSTARFTDYIGNGSQITNLTASNIDNFTQDVRAQFTAGTDITIVGGVISSTAGGGGSTPGGPDTSVQFNSGSTLSGSSELIYNYNTNTLSGTVSQFTAVSSSYLVLSGNAEPEQTEGTIFYDNTNGLLRQWTEVTNVDLHLGQQLAVRIKNDSGITLSKGKVVHITGSTNSDTPLVTTASYESDSVSADTLGVLMSELAADETGYALLYGVLTGINLSTYDSGDMLYLSSSGDFSNSVPQSPLHEVRIGQVTRATSNGAMFVRIQNGYEIDELHDVLISGKQNGDLLSWDSSALVWKNTKELSGSYIVSGTLTAAAGDNTFGLSTGLSLELGKANSNTTGAIKLWGTTTDSYSLIQSTTSNLHLDAPTGIYLNYYDGDFVQVGSEIRVPDGNQTDPQYTFFNDPDTGMFLGGTNELAFTTSGSERLRIDDTGNVGIGTTSPADKLNIYGGNLLISNNSTTIGNINFLNTGTSNGMRIMGYETYLTVDTIGGGVGEILRIQRNNGYVGIGTTSPTSKFDVYNGIIRSRSNTNACGFEAVKPDAYSLDAYNITDGTNKTFRIRDRGSATNQIDIESLYGRNLVVATQINNANTLTLQGSTIYLKDADTPYPNTVTVTNNTVGIGTESPGANLDVSGSTIFGRLSSDTHEFSGSVNVSGTLTATAKSFDIEHPTKEGMRLRYGSLEGPENGVYVRGTTTESVIELPEHWTGLVDEETITVNLTPYGTSQQLWVKKIEDNKVYIGGKLNKCFFTVFGERKDIDKLVVEY